MPFRRILLRLNTKSESGSGMDICNFGGIDRSKNEINISIFDVDFGCLFGSDWE